MAKQPTGECSCPAPHGGRRSPAAHRRHPLAGTRAVSYRWSADRAALEARERAVVSRKLTELRRFITGTIVPHAAAHPKARGYATTSPSSTPSNPPPAPSPAAEVGAARVRADAMTMAVVALQAPPPPPRRRALHVCSASRPGPDGATEAITARRNNRATADITRVTSASTA